MYDNLQRNDGPTYSNRVAYDEIVKTYDDAVTAGASKQVAVDAMARVIEDQVSRGVYISDHLTGDAVDIRCRDMSDEQRDAFEEAVDDVLGPRHWILESDHYHVHFR